MLYDDLFVRLERARWNFTDEIDFATIDHSLLTDQWIHDLRQICLTELSALYATEMFLRDFYTDIDFCSFVSIWFYEEMKHHMVLRRYLEACGETFDEEKELPALRLTFAEGPAIETLTMHFCGEQRLAHWYQAFSRSAPEPLLRKIFKILAADELRHAACYAKYLRKAIANKPDELPAVLRMTLWMLRSTNDAPKHPTTVTSPSVVRPARGPRVHQPHARLVPARPRPRGPGAAPDPRVDVGTGRNQDDHDQGHAAGDPPADPGRRLARGDSVPPSDPPCSGVSPAK